MLTQSSALWGSRAWTQSWGACPPHLALSPVDSGSIFIPPTQPVLTQRYQSHKWLSEMRADVHFSLCTKWTVDDKVTPWVVPTFGLRHGGREVGGVPPLAANPTPPFTQTLRRSLRELTPPPPPLPGSLVQPRRLCPPRAHAEHELYWERT